ncbi:MAG TPA: carboxyl transferase domain-containing protein [Acidimicrobiales bacterium]
MLHPLQAEWDADLLAGDPLSFPDYAPPGEESVRTGLSAAGYVAVHGRFDVLGGSMGAAHGERVVRAYRRARDLRLPVVVTSASGGARMQEGMVALLQLARTAAAARDHAAAGLLQVAVLRGPTTGGVFASYVSLADVIAAEPGVTIGFAGPRVVEMTTGERLGDGSHTAESAYRHGLVDALVARADQPAFVETALGLSSSLTGFWARSVRNTGVSAPKNPTGPVGSAWDEVLAARDPGRPSGDWWAETLCSSWVPLRAAPPDPCITAGLATIDGRRAVVVAMNRARPQPSGYRLAQRAAALAGRVGLPVVTLVDTPGADPSPASEAGGIAREIARTFAALDALPTVSVAVCVGEGGSGGALALAHCDRLLLLDHAIFSVIAPEGAAAILDRDASTAPERAQQLRLTAPDLLELGIVDEVLREDEAAVRKAILRALDDATPDDRRRRADAATGRWLR